MKISKKEIVVALVAACALLAVFFAKNLVLAQTTTPPTNSTPPTPPAHTWHHHMHMRGFFLGICVGQTLAQKNIILPIPQKGQAFTPPSPELRAEIHAAVTACRTQMGLPPFHHHPLPNNPNQGAQ